MLFVPSSALVKTGYKVAAQAYGKLPCILLTAHLAFISKCECILQLVSISYSSQNGGGLLCNILDFEPPSIFFYHKLLTDVIRIYTILISFIAQIWCLYFLKCNYITRQSARKFHFFMASPFQKLAWGALISLWLIVHLRGTKLLGSKLMNVHWQVASVPSLPRPEYFVHL